LEEHITSIFRVEEQASNKPVEAGGELSLTLLNIDKLVAGLLCLAFHLLLQFSCLVDSSDLKVAVTCSSKMPGFL
jgi:hypothetical protein